MNAIETILITLFIIYSLSYLSERFWLGYFQAKERYEKRKKETDK